MGDREREGPKHVDEGPRTDRRQAQQKAAHKAIEQGRARLPQPSADAPRPGRDDGVVAG